MRSSLDHLTVPRSSIGSPSQHQPQAVRHARAVEDVDLAEAIVKLTAEQNQLEAALGAIGRTSGMTLMGFLR